MATDLEKKETKTADVFDRLDRLFDEWMGTRGLWRGRLARGWAPVDSIRVDEFQEGNELVVKAELPGIDPDKDVELTVSDGLLRIEAERREEQKTEDRGYLRQELTVGSFVRTLPLPTGVSETNVKATYKDGILEVRVPLREETPARKITIEKK